MKYSEIEKLSVEEIKSKLEEGSKNLRSLKFAHAVSPIENPMSIRNLRKDIARLKTALHARLKAQ